MRIAPWLRSASRAGLLAATLSSTVASGVMSSGAARAEVPAEASPDAAAVTRGASLAEAADCSGCHHGIGGEAAGFSGGLIMPSPLGTVSASNITPDGETGIGRYSEEEFARALRQGIRRDGARLYPAMPFPSYRALTDGDVHALYVYFMKGVAPVHNTVPAPTMLIPRAAIRLWSAMEGGQAGVAPPGDPALRKGWYLTDVLGHCSACHSPRNVLLGEKGGRHYLTGGDLGGWFAPNLTPDVESGIGAWSNQDIVTYLRTGRVVGKAGVSGFAGGGMAEVVEHSTSHLSDEDLGAIAQYLKSVPPVSSAASRAPGNGYHGAPPTHADAVFISSCAACHRPDGLGSADSRFPAVVQPAGAARMIRRNQILTILGGVSRRTRAGTAMMPAFRDTLDDQSIAALVNLIDGPGGGETTAAQVKALRGGVTRDGVWYEVAFAAVALIVAGIVVLVVRRIIFRRRAGKPFTKTGG